MYQPIRTGRRAGFTLMEAMSALSVTAIAGSVLLLSLEASLDSTDDARNQTIANGIALQMVDEVLGTLYVTPGSSPYQYPLSPSSWEAAGKGRERYNDTDDFHGFVADSAEDIWGQPLGQGDDLGGLRHVSFRVPSSFFANWRQEIEVYYVSETSPSTRLAAGLTSNLRAVEVRIKRRLPDKTYQELANIRRVFAYVPSPG